MIGVPMARSARMTVLTEIFGALIQVGCPIRLLKVYLLRRWRSGRSVENRKATVRRRHNAHPGIVRSLDDVEARLTRELRQLLQRRHDVLLVVRPDKIGGKIDGNLRAWKCGRKRVLNRRAEGLTGRPIEHNVLRILQRTDAAAIR